MARLEIWVSGELLQRLKALAARQYEDTHCTALGKVVEAALHWWLEKGAEQQKPTTQWDFPQLPTAKETSNGIRRWLFRR